MAPAESIRFSKIKLRPPTVQALPPVPRQGVSPRKVLLSSKALHSPSGKVNVASLVPVLDSIS